MKYRKEGKSQVISAAKAGFSERSARNIQNRQFQEAKSKRVYRTRKDPFEDVWESELVPLLEKNPNLQAKTLLEDLQLRHTDGFPDKVLRSLQRRVQNWKAMYGPEKEVIFRQEHPPGWQGLSDFTSGEKLQITINNKSLEHILYHYRLAYSGWEHAEVILGGESYTALTEGLQNALWQCGGVPETHRTDSLSAAFKNLSSKEKEDFTKAYEEFTSHYGMEATRNNKGVSHENGTIETSHRHLKSRIDQALMIRGNRDFATLEEYRHFIRNLVTRQNCRIQKEYLEEVAELKDLPERKTTDFTEIRVKVTNSSTILVKDVIYSVPSRLIGMTLKIHLYDSRLECFIGGESVFSLERKRRGRERIYQIDYRHLVGQLLKKPGAFNNYIYKEEMYPTFAFRQTWERLVKELGSRNACREYVAILKEAAYEERESRVNAYLEKRLTQNEFAVASDVRALFRQENDFPTQEIACTNLKSYSQFLGGNV